MSVNPFTFAGFVQPVDNAPVVNTVKNGSTVPVKWKLQGEGGIPITSISSVVAGWPKQTKISCSNLSSVEDAIETVAAGGTSLRYDATEQQFVYNWATPKQAGTCWKLGVKFSDETIQTVYFKLK